MGFFVFFHFCSGLIFWHIECGAFLAIWIICWLYHSRSHRPQGLLQGNFFIDFVFNSWSALNAVIMDHLFNSICLSVHQDMEQSFCIFCGWKVLA
jgi:hypothetical protein